MDDVTNAGNWVLNLLEAHPWILITIIAHFAILGAVAYLILLERWTASWVQDRLGPNRTSLGFGIIPWLKDMKMFGLGQPLADGMKFILKEDYRPKGVDAVLFTLAPIIMISVVILSIAVLPWGGVKQTTRDIDVASWTGAEPAGVRGDLGSTQPESLRAYMPADEKLIRHTEDTKDQQDADGVWRQHLISTITYQYNFQTASLNIGVLFILAALSLAVYGVVLGGWASNNKYSFLGALRATANMISYEIPLGLAVLCVVIIFGTLNLDVIVNKQAHYWWGFIPAWNVFSQPIAFILFLICIHAEANRAPFDLAEAEQELVGGYHTEYSSMRFALFFLGEYAGMITTSAVCVALFFGGWHLPWIEWVWKPLSGNVDPVHPEITTSLIACIIRALVFFGKTLAIVFIFMWVRWSLPRFRFDQLMQMAWRALIPMSLGLLVTTAIVVYYFGGAAGPDEFLSIGQAFVLLLANGVWVVATVGVSLIIPAAPATNRKIVIPGSRFRTLPKSPAVAPAA